jgi:hypothetical protein
MEGQVQKPEVVGLANDYELILNEIEIKLNTKR